MCQLPCQTCSANYFSSCLTCSNAWETLTGSLCLATPTSYYQIGTTCLIFMFLLPVLLRKRCLTLVRILDMVQIATYFKLIYGYCAYRHVWLYLGMRSWGIWSEGWTIISGDYTPPVWTVEQGIINKTIRIASTWVFCILFMFIMGILKVALDERQLTMNKFLQKNFGNVFSYAFYFTLQDIGFVIAVPILYPSFSSTFGIISFALAIFFAIFSALMMIWAFCRINYEDSQQKYYFYKYFFLFSADYDIFPTYDLLDLPSRAKQTKKYSNIRLIDMIKKIVYAFFITSYLLPAAQNSTASDQVFQIAALIVFFQMFWFVMMPYNLRKEFLQFIIYLLALAVLFYLLFAPWYIQNQIVHTAFVLTLFGLGLLSLIVEICFSMYKIVPVDLYETGLKVVIEDHRLLKELAVRKREQEDIMKSLKELEEQNQKLKKQMEEKNKAKAYDQETKQKIQTNNKIRQNSQASLQQHKNVLKTKTQLHQPEQYQREGLPQQRESMNSEEAAELYKIDQLKRRKIYQWNKQQPFVYSNKME